MSSISSAFTKSGIIPKGAGQNFVYAVQRDEVGPKKLNDDLGRYLMTRAAIESAKWPDLANLNRPYSEEEELHNEAA